MTRIGVGEQPLVRRLQKLECADQGHISGSLAKAVMRRWKATIVHIIFLPYKTDHRSIYVEPTARQIIFCLAKPSLASGLGSTGKTRRWALLRQSGSEGLEKIRRGAPTKYVVFRETKHPDSFAGRYDFRVYPWFVGEAAQIKVSAPVAVRTEPHPTKND